MGKWLDKDGLIDLKTRIKTKVDTKVDKYTEESAGKFLQTDSNGNAVWGTAASPSAVAEATEQWLDDHVSGGSTIAVDDSLTVEGAAADAKATGALVKSAATQPTDSTNRLWINESSETEYQVPTYGEFSDLKSAFDDTKGTVDTLIVDKTIDELISSESLSSGGGITSGTFTQSGNVFTADNSAVEISINKAFPVGAKVLIGVKSTVAQYWEAGFNSQYARGSNVISNVYHQANTLYWGIGEIVSPYVYARFKTSAVTDMQVTMYVYDVTDFSASDISRITDEMIENKEIDLYYGKVPTLESEYDNLSETALVNVPYTNLATGKLVPNSMLDGWADGTATGCVRTDYIDVVEYGTISYNYTPTKVIFYDSSKTKISDTSSTYRFHYVPATAKYMRCFFVGKDVISALSSMYRTENNDRNWTMDQVIENLIITNGSGANAIGEITRKRIESTYKNEIWVAFGDSLSEAREYEQFVSAYYGLNGYSAESSIGGTSVHGSGANCFWQDVRINSLNPIADVITIAGGTNDLGATIGDIDFTNWDTSTYAGSYNTMLYKILYRYQMLTEDQAVQDVDVSGVTQVTAKNVKLFIVAPPYCDNRDLTDIYNATVQIAKLWGIPCVKSMEMMGVTKFNADLYFGNDRTHFLRNMHKLWAEVMIGVYDFVEPLN